MIDVAIFAMPFSPVEYPISSRKRLVEDLSANIANARLRAESGARHG
jgi:hypothetical protein